MSKNEKLVSTLVITAVPFLLGTGVWIWRASARVAQMDAQILSAQKQAIRIMRDANDLTHVVRMVHEKLLEIDHEQAVLIERLDRLHEDIHELKRSPPARGQ